MSARHALQAIAVISLVGVLFSGALTWREFAGTPAGCSALGAPGTILGYPPCLYGLVMYAVVFALALAGLPAASRTETGAPGPGGSAPPEAPVTR